MGAPGGRIWYDWAMSATRTIAAVLIMSAAALAQPDPSQLPKPEKLPGIPMPGDLSSFNHDAVKPVSREKEQWWKDRNESFNVRAKQGAENGDIDLIFLGDSITHGWEGKGKETWEKYYANRHAFNIGISGDRTQHVIWRLQHGNVDGLAHPAKGHAPRLVVVMIGTNNSNGKDHIAEEIADGIKVTVSTLREKLPETKILLLAIFPRGERPNAQREKNAIASDLASKVADGKMVHYLDIGPKFLDENGVLSSDIMPDALHPNEKGYQIWAEAMEPKLKELLGEKDEEKKDVKPGVAGS